MYYTLLIFCKINKLWFAEFGDYDYKVVKQEALDSYPDDKCKIIHTADSQTYIDNEISRINVASGLIK